MHYFTISKINLIINNQNKHSYAIAIIIDS